MPSLTDELMHTRTAQWHRLARTQRCSAAWKMRELCFAALTSALESEARSSPGPDHARGRPQVNPPSLSVIARMVSAAPATLYNWWGADQGAQTVARWAGPDPTVKPSLAFMAEAKVVSFWPYRSGCLSVADAFDMNMTELLSAYYRTLAVWATDRVTLANCRPSGAPSCVAEDLAVIARFAPGGPANDREYVCERLTMLADRILSSILEDASLTPAVALDGICEEMSQLLTPQEDRLADRVEATLTELADRILHCEPHGEVLTGAQSRKVQRAMARIGLTVGSGVMPDAARSLAAKATNS